MSDSLAEKLRKDCQLLLDPEPLHRPAISSYVLNDQSSTYLDWSRAMRNASTALIKTGREYEWNFWNSVDANLLSQLCLEHREILAKVDATHKYPANVLFGMALGHLQPGFPPLGIKYFRAAAESDSNAAKGIVFRLSRALASAHNPSQSDAEAITSRLVTWLYDYASSGSLIAAADLQLVCPKKREAAWNTFRQSGGYAPMLRQQGAFPLPGNDRSMDPALVKQSSDAQENCEPCLYPAAARGDHTLVLALLSQSTDPTTTSHPFGIRCLHWLFMFDEMQIEHVAKELLLAGACVQARTLVVKEGNFHRHIPNEHFPFHWPIGTPFHWACFARCWRAMSTLLDFGANIDELNALDDDQAQTPIAMAMYRGDSEVVKFLLEHGADPHRVDGYEEEALKIVKLFRNGFHYHAERYAIPSEGSQKALSKRIVDFIDAHDETENLLVVHYGGHGDENADQNLDDERRSVWAAYKEGGPTVYWYDIQPHFNYVYSDVLLPLDCCHSSQGARDTITCEMHAGCAMKRETLLPGQHSFTTALIREIKELLTRHGEVEVAELYTRLVNRRARFSESPIYVPLRRKVARERAWLEPIGLPDESERLADDTASLWLRIGVDGSKGIDAALFQKVITWMRRGLPPEMVDLNVEKILMRAEKLEKIVHHGDHMLNGQPILEAMDGPTQLSISKAWRPMKGLLLGVNSIWAMSGFSGMLGSAASLHGRLVEFVQGIHAQNEVVTEAIGRATALIQQLDEDTLHQLEHDETAEASGLAETFRLRRLVRYSEASSPSLEISVAGISPVVAAPGASEWQLRDTNELVVVERKYYGSHDSSQRIQRASERVRSLASLLAAKKSEAFYSLGCLYWFHDDYHNLFGLVFGIPTVYNSSGKPLSEFFRRNKRLRRPNLEDRFKVAACLCQALQKWHSTDWLHKGICSDNIFIFQRKDSEEWDFGHPFLGGHEYARPGQEISSARFVQDFKENVYRHPNRQGLPRDFHTKSYDICSLEVVLLEIGLWQTVLDFPEFLKKTATLTPEFMQSTLKQNAENRLGHYMGNNYKDAVYDCLAGAFGSEENNSQLGLRIAQDFQVNVVDRITTGIHLR
ncbi:hypothetical protein MMC25_000698 [Agyrium rufum]|nr:hypothetical protein [Agyrium rufum]